METKESNWNKSATPASVSKRHGSNHPAKRYDVYKDGNVRVQHVYEPTYFSQLENYIDVSIQKPFTLFHVPIGGCMTYNDAIEHAKRIIKAIIKSGT